MPGFLKYPQVEVKAFMVMNMGMLDSGADVLVDVGAAAGWRIIGAMECSCALIFIIISPEHGRFPMHGDAMPKRTEKEEKRSRLRSVSVTWLSRLLRFA